MSIQPFIDDNAGNPRFLFQPPKQQAGYNRNAGESMLASDDDWLVLLEFLREYTDNRNTYRSYCREIERFSLWLINEANKSISHVKRDDWLAYQAFIENPEPVKTWCAKKQRRLLKDGRMNPDWRPFEIRQEKAPVNEPDKDMTYIQGLSANSAKKAHKTLESLFAFLVENNYLSGNPAAARRRRRSQQAHTRKQIKDRFLEVDLIDFTIDLLFAQQKNAAASQRPEFPFIRARYLIQLLAGTGLRISEAASHVMGDINCRTDQWTLDIIGKGDKPRSIRYLPDLIQSTREFRLNIGLPSSTPLFNESVPLIPRQNCQQAISDRRVDQILRWAFGMASDEKMQQSERYSGKRNEQEIKKLGDLHRDASILAKASAHWLRHSHATYFLKKTNDLKATMERLGHADVGTTMIYQHVIAEDEVTEF